MAQQGQYASKSRLALRQPAIRTNMKGKMLLSGPSGAGKTYSALLIASVLAGADRTTDSILMIDTEKSGTTYADEFGLADGSPGYTHFYWQEPYNATDLAMTLRDASKHPDIDVVIVDSHTHFWRGQGGVLDTASGRYTGWKEARPMQADMVDAILTCDCHVILCAREVQEHVQEKDGDRWVVRKLGMKVQQDSDLEYEMNVGLSVDMNHVLHVSKSRTRAVPVGREFIAGHAEEFAGLYRDWLAGGEPACSLEQLDALIGTLNRIGDAALRQQAKLDFMDAFGRPESLLVSRLPEAQEWVADRVLGVNEKVERGPDEVPAQDAEPAPAAVEDVPAAEGAEPAQEDATEAHGDAEPDLRAAMEAKVAAMGWPKDVMDELTMRGKSTQGSRKVLTKRLVDALVRAETPI